jgi:hypothetical protein
MISIRREQKKNRHLSEHLRCSQDPGSPSVKRVFRGLFDDLFIVGGTEGVKQLTAINQLNDKAVSG